MSSEENSENKKLLFKEGANLLHNGKYKEANEILEKVIAIDPEDTLALLSKSNALINVSKYEEAIEVLDKAIKIDPEDKLIWLSKVDALIKLNKYEEALEASDRAIKICEKHSGTLNKEQLFVYSGAWIGKVQALDALKRYEDILEALNKEIEIFEKYSGTLDERLLLVYSGAWHGKGDTLAELKRYEVAIEAFDKAIEIKPNNDQAWLGKFFTAWNNHKEEKALQIIENALLSPELKDKLQWWELKTLVLMMHEDYGKALEACNNGLKINPEDVELWLDKGDIFFKLEAYRYALKSYEKAITIEPKNTTAWKHKGMSLLYLDRHTEFLKAFEQAINLDSNDDEIYSILAEYYLTFGDIKNASKYIEDASLLNKENAKSLYMLGKIKIEEQNYITSINCFEKAISLELRNVTYLLWDSYAKYLMAELELASDDKQYQDSILGIIRELRKIDNCNNIEYNTSQIISNWFFRIIPYKFKKITGDSLEIIKRATIDLNISEERAVKILGKIHSILAKFKSNTNVAYNYYFLGCFYYKINDYFTAIDCLKQCTKLNSDPEINNSAIEIIDNIWNNKIRPSFWKWWLQSPSNLWFKRISFIILITYLFGILLPIQSINLFENSFFSPINWAENAVQLALLTLSIVFILTSPNIQYFKSSQIEIEIRPPTVFELTPSLIEKKLNDLQYERPHKK